AVFALPILGLVVAEAHEAEALARLQGTQFDLFALKNLQTLDCTQQRRTDSPLLRVWNADLDLELVPVETVLNGSWQRFLEGMNQKQGEYVLTLVRAEAMQPLLVIPLRGGFDTSGTLTAACEALSLRAEDAVIQLRKLLETAPDTQDVRYHLGRAYETLALQGKKPREHSALTRQLFDEELALNPSNVKAIAGIGLWHKRAGQWAEAEHWLRRALDLAPTNIPILLSLATTVFNRVGVGPKGTPVSEEAFGLLAQAWDLSPRHPEVRTLAIEWGRLFRRDLLREFRGRPARISWP
ncbi:MAG TPA: hypothetical protein PKO06_01425, partial [Candidatus Ozemobacteraceae bacterium]|nr:hypothetical protein [Candidatus Ozemobacteraceae bacterium]